VSCYGLPKGRTLAWLPLARRFKPQFWNSTARAGRLLRGYGLAGFDRQEPAVRIGLAAIDDGEERLLQLLRDGAAVPLAHRDAVHRANRRDLGGGAGEKRLVGDVEHLARDHLLDDFYAQILRDLDHRSAGDSRQHGVAGRRRPQPALAHEKEILARTFTDVAGGVEGDAFGIAVDQGFHLDQLRVHVIGAGFGQRGQRVRRQPVPTRNAHIHALRHRLFAQVLAPLPAGDVDVDRIVERVHAHFAVTAEHDRAHVAGGHPVHAHQLDHRLGWQGVHKHQVFVFGVPGVQVAVLDRPVSAFVFPFGAERRREVVLINEAGGQVVLVAAGGAGRQDGERKGGGQQTKG